MTIDQLLFVGLNGYVVALDRETGDIVWSNNELKSGYVTLLVDGDRLIQQAAAISASQQHSAGT